MRPAQGSLTRLAVSFCLTVVIAPAATSPARAEIVTVAGTGLSAFGGDGGPAAAADLAGPFGVAVNAAGDIFIADFFNNRVRRVDAMTGVITTVAGNGSFGFSGDGGPATQAALYFPRHVALDHLGNLFINDSRNFRVRRVDAVSGIITTVAGSGLASFWGDGGPATAAGFAAIRGIAVDSSGNLFIADARNQVPEPPCNEDPFDYACGNRIRRVDAATGIITTIAGSSVFSSNGDSGPAISATFSGIVGLDIDAADNLYVGDVGLRPEWEDLHPPTGNRIRRIDAATGIITTVAGNGNYGFGGDGGPATGAMVLFPSGFAVDAGGNLFFADSGNNRVRRVDAATGIITTVAGTGAAGYNGDEISELLAELSFPNDVLLEPSGSFLIADTSNNRVRRADLACAPGGPPQISLWLDPVLLWPPNHRMVTVEASVYTAAGCGDPQISLASVVSDEPDNAPGGSDGNTDDDIQDATIGTDDRSFSVRAERSGPGSGRTYLVTYTATDAEGRTASATATVSVPLSKGGGVDPVSVSVDEGDQGTFLEWDPVPDSLFYNVIRGAIAGLRETTTSIDLGPVVCLEARSQSTNTFSNPDAEHPPAGGAFFYLVEYDAGLRSGYGAESASKPRVPSAGACP